MSKTMTKFLTLVFLGLLSISVPFSHARAEEAASHGGDHGIKMQDAWQYMKENSSQWEDFSEVYGSSEKDRNQNAVPCGSVMCNLDKKVCLRKESRGWFRDTVSGYAAMVTYGLIGDIQKTTNYEYKCVDKAKSGDYTSKGWYDAGRNEKNLKSSTTDTFGGDVTKRKHDKTAGCYTASANKSTELKQYCVVEFGDKVSVKAVDDGGDGCEVIPVRWYNNKECTFCALLGGAYKVADTIAQTAKIKLAASFAIVIAMGLMVWVAMKTLVFVSSMTKQDAAKYITELIKQSYKFMIAFFALLFYQDVFNLIILPLLNAGLIFGTSLVSVSSIKDRFGVDENMLLTLSDLPVDYSRNSDNTLYPFNIYVRLEHFAYNVNLQYALLQTIGGSLVCLGWNYMIGFLGSFDLGLGMACVTYGAAFSVFGFFLCMAFVFYLFDAVVQLGIVGGLLPFLIASWPFKITSKYTSTGFKMLLNSIFTFMMMGVIVKIGMELVNAAVKLNANPETGEDNDLSALASAIDNLDTEKLKLLVNVLSIGFCLFMFANIMGFLLISRVNELVNRFASGGMKGAAPGLATVAASTAKGMATKLAAPTMDAVGKWTGDKIENGTKWAVNKTVGLATLRPIRKWGVNKFNEKFNKGKEEKEAKKRKDEITGAQQQISGDGKTNVSLGRRKPETTEDVTLGGSRTKPEVTPAGRKAEPQSEQGSKVSPHPELGTRTPPQRSAQPKTDDLL